jgi:TatA/E family protein of Tat protein translocase
MFDSLDDWLIIAVVVAILFYGSSKIPQLARSMGRAFGEFKRGRTESERELAGESRPAASAAAAPAPGAESAAR